MMNTIVLLLDKRSAFSPEAWIAKHNGQETAFNRIVENADGWLSIHRDDGILSEYDDEERNVISKWIEDPAVYLIEWRGEALLKKFLQSIPDAAVIDNDHGLIIPVGKIKDIPAESWIKANFL